MTKIANNLRIAFSSNSSQNKTFNITDLFLNASLPNGAFIQFNIIANQGLAAEFSSLFEFTTLPSDKNETFELTVLSDLSSQKGSTYTVTLWAVEPNLNGVNEVTDEYKLEIEILDDTANTVDAITVRENQLGQIFDPSAIDFSADLTGDLTPLMMAIILSLLIKSSSLPLHRLIFRN